MLPDGDRVGSPLPTVAAVAKSRKPRKIQIRDVSDVPLRELSGLALRGQDELLAVGDSDPLVFTAGLQWPPIWRGIDLGGLGLPDGGTQFEAVEAVGADAALVLQEQPARVLFLDLAVPAWLATLALDIPAEHPLHEQWLGDRSSRGESILLTGPGHLLVIKEKNPAALVEFGPPGDPPFGWRRGEVPAPPAPADAALTALATWRLGGSTGGRLPDVSDATVGPDGCLYLLSDQGGAIARLPDTLDPDGGTIDASAIWRIAGRPEKPEGLVFLPDGTPLVGLDTKSPRGNLLRLEQMSPA
jgi:hypothetical protein